ncbi:signal peptidase I, partial [Streptomyces rochei]
RSASSDSRDHLGSPGGGMVPVDEVIGRADWIVWPFGHATHLDRPDAYARVPEAEAGEADGAGTADGVSGGTAGAALDGAAGGARRSEGADG